MPTLYQKYRPQKFADLVDQEHIVQTITNEISANKIAQAYLFFGPRGIGKTTLARLFAKSLNCEHRQKGDFEPCGECSSCQEITISRNIDVIEIDAASHTGVDNVRENIIENAQFKPTKSKYKIFIIDEVHMLSTQAFNALLKTIEEPPAHVIFILATTETHKLPLTIISRCQRFSFKKIGYDIMMKRLKKICEEEKIKVDKDVLERVINKSDGCLRDAESLLGQILSLNLKSISIKDAELILPTSNASTILQFLEHILQKETKPAIELLQQLTDEGANLEQFAYDFIEILRLMMILQTDPTKNIKVDYSEKDAKKIKKLATEISTQNLIQMIESAIIRRVEIKSSPIPQLPLELFVIQFTSPNSTIKFTPQSETKQYNNETMEPSPQDVTLASQSNSIDDQPKSNNNETIIEKIKDRVTSFTTHKKTFKTTLEEIKTKWFELIDKIASENHSLGFILKMSEARKVEDGVLYISVPYSFHKDKLEESKTIKIMDNYFEKCFAEKINYCCQIVPVNSSPDETPAQPDPELKELAADFGGEVVS
jgi:DNA polymerase-3 subunit gamma/tau